VEKRNNGTKSILHCNEYYTISTITTTIHIDRSLELKYGSV